MRSPSDANTPRSPRAASPWPMEMVGPAIKRDEDPGDADNSPKAPFRPKTLQEIEAKIAELQKRELPTIPIEPPGAVVESKDQNQWDSSVCDVDMDEDSDESSFDETDGEGGVGGNLRDEILSGLYYVPNRNRDAAEPKKKTRPPAKSPYKKTEPLLETTGAPAPAAPTRKPRVDPEGRRKPKPRAKSPAKPKAPPAAPAAPKLNPMIVHDDDRLNRTQTMMHRWDRDFLGDVRRYREPNAIPTRKALRTSQPRIVMRCPDAKNADFLVDDKLINIGRDVSNNSFVIPHCSVSKSHARIFWSGRRFVLEDVGSTNRTRVGGEALGRGQRVQLRSHQAIRFGGVPCLFLMQPLVERRHRGPAAKRVLTYLVEKGWISKHQARDAHKTEKGRIDEIAARFVRLGVVTPEQWEEAFKWAEAAAVMS